MPVVRKSFKVQPIKYVYSQENGDCRTTPYYKSLLLEASEWSKKNCSQFCRPTDFWLCPDEETQDSMDICQDKEHIECFYNAIDAVRRNVLSKPCTQIDYKVEFDGTWDREENLVEFDVRFSHPPHVIVKEEYLIYDLISGR